MRRVGRDVNGLALFHDRLRSTKGYFDFTIQENERFFKVVPVRRRTTTRRDMHIDKAEPSTRVLSAQNDRVGVSDQSDMGQGWIV